MDSHVEIERALAGLTARTYSVQEATAAIPDASGLYAWWVVGDALPGVPTTTREASTGAALVYIGVAPNAANSKKTLRSRVVDNHLNGSIATSTVRHSLASLVVDKLSLKPTTKGTKVALPPEQNTELTAWQSMHLRLSWHATPDPWLIESAVIAALAPPLNLAGNEGHAFHGTLTAARAALKQSAR